jgi:hypothetical protein
MSYTHWALRLRSLWASFSRADAAQWGAIAIFTLALGVRLWGITFGVPHDLTADEPHYIVQALKVGAGEGGPLLRIWHTVGKGGLDYLLFIEYGVVFVVLWLTGVVHEPRDFALLYLRDPTVFYLVGRVTVAVLGAATVLATYGVARRLYGAGVGLAAAFVGAVAYYHVAESHIINVHVPMACALAGALLAFITFEQRGSRRSLMLAGALCGAAIALAYTAGLALLMMLAALVSRPTRQPLADHLRDLAALVAPAILLIALMSPDLLLGMGLLLGNFANLFGGANNAGDTGSARSFIDAVTILRSGDWGGFVALLVKPNNVLVTIAAIGGAAIGVWRRERWTLILAAATVLFLAVVSISNRGVNEAYLFPIAPVMWTLAARGLGEISTGRRWSLALVTLAVSGYSLYEVVRDDRMISHPDTREIAKDWFETHVPSGAKVLMDGMRFRYVPGIPLQPDRNTVARRLDNLESSELTLSPQMLSLYREAAESVPGPTYDLHSTVYGLEVEDIDYYVRESFDFIVISSFNQKRFDSEAERQRYPKSARFYDEVRRDPRLRVVFSIEPAVWQRSGPTLTVYAVQHGRSDEPITSDRR